MRVFTLSNSNRLDGRIPVRHPFYVKDVHVLSCSCSVKRGFELREKRARDVTPRPLLPRAPGSMAAAVLSNRFYRQNDERAED